MHPSLTSFTFGAEFEVLLPFTMNRASAVATLARLSGLPVHNGRRDAPPGAWMAVDDGSLQGAYGQYGLEFISPLPPHALQGDNGLEQVRKVCAALQAMGATVNSTCGFHVHVGQSGTFRREGLATFKNLVKLYARYEDVLDTFMPASRRGNGATYCRSVKGAQVEQCTSVGDIAYAIARVSRAVGVRYHKVNLEAVSKHGTIEFRQHAGTVDGDKATNWIVKCLRMVLAAKQGRTGEGAMIAIETVNFALKTRAVLEMCGRTDGASLREICERFGFNRVSVVRHARIAGVAFTKRRGRFYINGTVPATTTTVEPVTVEGLANVLEESPEEREFFVGRARALAAQ